VFKEVVRDDQGLSSFHKFNMGFEFHNQNLAKELHERKHVYDDGDYDNSSMKFFSEPEVWYLISSFASVIKTFEEHGYHHGDIQPKNILVDPSGFVKILDNSLVNYGKIGYQKMVFDATYTTALSPILIDSLKERELNPRHDKVKSDIFSLGITALCAATNNSINHYYDWVNKRVRMAYRSIGENPIPGSLKNTVDDDLDRMQNIIGYSPQLVNTIRAMLHENESQRIGIDELLEFLEQHQSSSIMGKNTFASAHSLVKIHIFKL
jgi:serine/threonine protein kinase